MYRINKIIKCIKGYVIDGINDCDENCDLQVGIGHGNCYAECLKCGGSYIETENGMVCTDCESNGTDI